MRMLTCVQVPHDINHQPCASSRLQRDFFSSAMAWAWPEGQRFGVVFLMVLPHTPTSWLGKSTGFPVSGGHIQPPNCQATHPDADRPPSTKQKLMTAGIPPSQPQTSELAGAADGQVQGWPCGPSELIPPSFPSWVYCLVLRTLDSGCLVPPVPNV